MRKNCSSAREKLSKFEAEGLEFSKILRSQEQFIHGEGSEQFFVKECSFNMFLDAFLTCSWRFLRSNRLKQLEFKLENIIGI